MKSLDQVLIMFLEIINCGKYNWYEIIPGAPGAPGRTSRLWLRHNQYAACGGVWRFWRQIYYQNRGIRLQKHWSLSYLQLVDICRTAGTWKMALFVGKTTFKTWKMDIWVWEKTWKIALWNLEKSGTRPLQFCGNRGFVTHGTVGGVTKHL